MPPWAYLFLKARQKGLFDTWKMRAVSEFKISSDKDFYTAKRSVIRILLIWPFSLFRRIFFRGTSQIMDKNPLTHLVSIFLGDNIRNEGIYLEL